MNLGRLLHRLSSVHALSWRWAALALGTWLVTGYLSRVGIPPVDPHLEVEHRPLESLATLALSAPALVHAVPVRSMAGWLAVVSPRRARLLRGAWASGHLVVGVAASAGFVVVALPPGISGWQVSSVWAATWASSTGLVACGRSTAAALLPMTVLAGHSFRGLVPWDANLVYNPELVHPLVITAAALCSLAVIVTSLVPRRWW